MSEQTVRDGLALAVARANSAPSGPAAQVRTALVKGVSGKTAMCVLAGDEAARTPVSLAGHAASAGQTLAVVGQAGRWYAVGNLDA